MKHEEITEQFRMSQLASMQESRFLAYMEVDNWPELLHTTMHNLLRTPIFDDELKDLEGDAQTIL